MLPIYRLMHCLFNVNVHCICINNEANWGGGEVKRKIIELVFAASPLSPQH